ncbi:MAG: hypothetical protein U5M51_10550 [Emticicia sp.]|nr:hypothetical protein [Emticicia sp.]
MRHLYKNTLIVAIAFFLISAGLKQEKSTNGYSANKTAADSTIRLDKATGLVISDGLDLVTAHCTGCHSSKLITQFHTDRKGWLEKIRWMQLKQKLWDLGEAEPKILDYLAKNYPATEKVNRRAALKNIDWYRLK